MASKQHSIKEKDDPAKVLENTLCQLEKLTLTNTNEQLPTSNDRIITKENENCPPSCSTIALEYEKPQNYRFRPYFVPRILRRLSLELLPCRIKEDTNLRRRASIAIAQTTSLLDRIHLEGNFKDLSFRILRDSFTTLRNSSKKSPSIRNQSGNQSCSQEVVLRSSSYSAEEQGEIDELSEYFQHFVAVCPKMSALAESMYV